MFQFDPDMLVSWLLYAGVVFVLWEIGAGARGSSPGGRRGHGQEQGGQPHQRG
jgi:hypothetical protein